MKAKTKNERVKLLPLSAMAPAVVGGGRRREEARRRLVPPARRAGRAGRHPPGQQVSPVEGPEQRAPAVSWTLT